MEAVAGASRCGVGGCFGVRRESLPLASEARKLEFPGVKNCLAARRAGHQTAVHSRLPSAAFQDQSHVQFYHHVGCGGRKERLTNSVLRTTSSSAAAAALDEVVVDGGARDYPQRNDDKTDKKARKMAKKTLKKQKKAARAAAGLSSSSSSSSESEAVVATDRVAESRKIKMEQLKREWESISRSSISDSVPTFSPEFVIEQPRAPRQLPSPGESCNGRQNESVSAAVVSEALNGVMARRMSSADAPVSSRPRVSAASLAVPQDISSFVELFAPAPAARVEVCMSGSCRKAGAQQVISAFEANGVNASACNKCMKNCKLAVNVRVKQENDIIPKMYSGVGVEDAKALSRKYFGLSSPSGVGHVTSRHASAESLVH